MSTQHHHRHHRHHQASHSSETGNFQTKPVEEDGSIRLRAYEIYREKGGYALDNWLEAEHSVKNGH